MSITATPPEGIVAPKKVFADAAPEGEGLERGIRCRRGTLLDAVAAADVPNEVSHEPRWRVLTVLRVRRIVRRYCTGSRGPGRPLRRLGRTVELSIEEIRRVPLTALARRSSWAPSPRPASRFVRSALTFRTRPWRTCAVASLRRGGLPGSWSQIDRRACSWRRSRSSLATGQPITTGAGARRN